MQNILDSNSENTKDIGETPNKTLLATQMVMAAIEYANTNKCVIILESHVNENTKKILDLKS